MLNHSLKFLFLFTLLGLTSPARGNGVSFEASIGAPEVTLQNPEGGEAVYSGLGVFGRIYAPIWTNNKNFSSNFVLSGRYIDLNNNSNSNAQQETGTHIGLGAGLHFKIFKIILGVNSHVVKGRHFWVGDINNDYVEFNYNLLSYYAGLEWSFSKNFGLALSYEMASSTADINNNDVPYNESTYWLQFRFDTGASFGKFLGMLFK